jgi:hypothetical protein
MVDLRPRAQGLRVAALAARRIAQRNDPPPRDDPPPREDDEQGQENEGQGYEHGEEPLPPPPPAARGRGERGRGRGADVAGRGRGRGRAGREILPPPPYIPPPPPPDAYAQMLLRLGFSNEAITRLRDLGLTSLEDFCDISEKDIPSIMKELCRNNILVRQTSQNYLQALRYWVMRKERLQVNYTPQEFTDATLRTSLQ